MFENVIMPEVSASEMRGVLALLALIGNPQSKTAAEFLQKLSAEKDAAIEAQRQAAEDRAATEEAHASAKALHVDMSERLSRMEADLRAKLDAHAKAAEALHQREDDLRVRQSQHASSVVAWQKEVEAVKASHLVREAALTERELKVAEAHEDVEHRTAEFNKHMAPVLAAAALARQ